MAPKILASGTPLPPPKPQIVLPMPPPPPMRPSIEKVGGILPPPCAQKN